MSQNVDRVVYAAEAQVDEVRKLGLEVVHVFFPSAEAPARIQVKFPIDRPQWQLRKDLEAAGYEVGQKLGPNELAFYVSKRVEKTKGWSE